MDKLQGRRCKEHDEVDDVCRRGGNGGLVSYVITVVDPDAGGWREIWKGGHLFAIEDFEKRAYCVKGKEIRILWLEYLAERRGGQDERLKVKVMKKGSKRASVPLGGLKRE